MYKHLRWPILLGAMLALSTTVQAAPKEGEKFKDWTVQCEKIPVPDGKLAVKVEGSEDADKEATEEAPAPVKEQELCQIVQTLTEQSSEQPVLQMAVGYLPGVETPVGAFLLPLGIWLPPGVELRVDEGKTGRIPVDTCDPAGCRAGVELDNEFLDSMKKGKELNVTFGGRNRQGITVPISLEGFTAALDSLK